MLQIINFLKTSLPAGFGGISTTSMWQY